MIEALIDHLWQSTWFALAAALLVLVFRNNRASVRFRIWLVASLKFLVPLSVFVLIGKRLPWHTASAAHTPSALAALMGQIAQPGGAMMTSFAAPTPLADASSAPVHVSLWTIALVIWAVGFMALLCHRLYQWLKLNSIAWSSSPLPLEAPLPVRETAGTLEPGIFGICWPVLLLPKGLALRLTPRQLDAIIAHELYHWRRKDNLTAAIHMIVEALFWFHPLVWWVGNRMIVERERAVDEAVIHAGNDPEVYAAGILKVCQFYVESPLPCTAGVSGGTLRKRIEAIMTNRTFSPLHFAKQWLLGAAAATGVGGPIAIGLLSGPYATAVAQQPTVMTADADMKVYVSTEWKFGLEIPRNWNAFPPVPTNSPNEVIRFESREDGMHLLIVFRGPHDPKQDGTVLANASREFLGKHGFANFVIGETTIGTKKVVTLDFDRPTPTGGLWSCRTFYIIDGTLAYTLGFGTTNRAAMFPVYDKIAKTFVSHEPPVGS